MTAPDALGLYHDRVHRDVQRWRVDGQVYEEAGSVECPGCEEQCVRPRIVVTHGEQRRAFVACDLRDDVARVEVDLP